MKKIIPDGSPAFQGDVMFRSVPTLPAGAAKQPANGETIVAHSETGHHHVATGSDFDLYTVPNDPLHSYLVARAPIRIEHHRSTDTHETFKLDSDGCGGEVVWEIGRQREYTPAGWQRVTD